MKQDLAAGFQKVDTAQVDVLADFLERANNYPWVRECFDIQLAWLGIEPNNTILDIGCGIGDRAKLLAGAAGPNGQVYGVDLSESMIRIAKDRNKDNGLSLHFSVANAMELPFENAKFDRVRTERVLLYVPDVTKALSEVSRVLKPGGKFIAFDLDWDALTFVHPDRELTRRITRFISDSFPNNRIGAELPRYFREAGFKDIQVKPHGYLSHMPITRIICEGILATGVEKEVFASGEISKWWEVAEEENKNGNFFVCYQGFIVMGTKF